MADSELQLPYLLSKDDDLERYIVRRSCDGKHMRWIVRTDNGWEIEQELRPLLPVRHIAELPEPLRFNTRHGAALFLCMRGRAYRMKVNVGEPPKPFEIKVAPNFDSSQWCRCSPGQWVASVWDGQKRIDIACGDSLEDAKRAGYLKAHWGILPQPGEMELDRISKAVWEDGPAEPNIE